MSAMQLGVAVWVTDRGVGIAELASAVEQAGLESLFLTEHTHVPVSRGDVIQDEFHDQDPRILDPFTALGAAAAVTSRLKLGTGVCIVAQHDPIILAKQVATIDHLSGGRFLFGVGAGWLAEEMRNHGVRPELRWELMREQILAMKQIWTQDEAEFHGEYVNSTRCGCGPSRFNIHIRRCWSAGAARAACGGQPSTATDGRRSSAMRPNSGRSARSCSGCAPRRAEMTLT